MKTLQSLKKNLVKLLRENYSKHFGLKKKNNFESKIIYESNWLAKLHQSKSIKKIYPPLMWGITVISLSSVIGYRFYNQPQLSVGTLSPVKVIAPKDCNFEDRKTTEDKRKEVRTGIIPVLKRDPRLTKELKEELKKTISEIEQLRKKINLFSSVDVVLIPLSTQKYLRKVNERDWQIIQLVIINHNFQNIPASKPKIKQVVSQLVAYSEATSLISLKNLLEKIEQSRQLYNQTKAEASNSQASYLSSELFTTFLNLDDYTWQTVEKILQTTLNRILLQGLHPGIPDYLLKEIINIQLESTTSAVPKPAITKLLMRILKSQHNLTVDKEATKQRAEQAAQAVEAVIVKIKAGDIIVEAEEYITQEKFVLLDSFRLSRRGINWIGLSISVLIVIGTVVIFCLISQRINHSIRRRDHILICLLSLSTPLLGIFNLGYTNLPAIGLLSSSFYGPTLAITQVILLSGLSAFAATSINWSYILAGTAGGLLAASVAWKLRSRDELACLGGVVGIVQGSLYFIGYLIMAPAVGTIWSVILPESIIYGLSGIAWSVMGLGISPYLERLFDLVTSIRLVELANPNCGLLKRLATETPGTFQHTLFVACLAEAAARELDCNVELIRAGTLYHDIGKLHDPMGFIENQMGDTNKHDVIDDPWQSVKIIKKHVSEGLVMANKYGLPKVIRDFIPEHQGTLLISYFYHQAAQEALNNGENEISEQEFRYAGPIPQLRETGIVMLADGCEAALRSLKEATPEMALLMVQKIFKARWRDNQLKDSGIRYEELPIIAEVFVKVWQQFHHQRIVYPKSALEPTKNNKLS